MLNSLKIFRFIATGFFRSRLLALGERNKYLFAPSWRTLDMSGADINVWLDKNQKLPLSKNYFNAIYSSHMIEHFNNEKALSILFAECYRVLGKNGVFRIEAPDADLILKMYNERPHPFFEAEKKQRKSIPSPLNADDYIEDHIIASSLLVNYIDRSKGEHHISPVISKKKFDESLTLGIENTMSVLLELVPDEFKNKGGHQIAITFKKLERLLKRAGFKTVEKVDYNQTN